MKDVKTVNPKKAEEEVDLLLHMIFPRMCFLVFLWFFLRLFLLYYIEIYK